MPGPLRAQYWFLRSWVLTEGKAQLPLWQHTFVTSLELSSSMHAADIPGTFLIFPAVKLNALPNLESPMCPSWPSSLPLTSSAPKMWESLFLKGLIRVDRVLYNRKRCEFPFSSLQSNQHHHVRTSLCSSSLCNQDEPSLLNQHPWT